MNANSETYLVCSHCHEEIVRKWAGDEVYYQCEACGIYDAQDDDILEVTEQEYEDLIYED
jgi:uncharacterized Zn finger protein